MVYKNDTEPVQKWYQPGNKNDTHPVQKQWDDKLLLYQFCAVHFIFTLQQYNKANLRDLKSATGL